MQEKDLLPKLHVKKKQQTQLTVLAEKGFEVSCPSQLFGCYFSPSCFSCGSSWGSDAIRILVVRVVTLSSAIIDFQWF
jgi:hypothetical protein